MFFRSDQSFAGSLAFATPIAASRAAAAIKAYHSSHFSLIKGLRRFGKKTRSRLPHTLLMPISRPTRGMGEEHRCPDRLVNRGQ
jgi:hypothetical protein